MKFQNTVLSGPGRRYYTSANQVFRGSEADRKLDIFLTSVDVTLSNSEHDWSSVLVIGEHKQNPGEDRLTKTLIQLAGYAREVFGSQPDRRFVPGFTICGSLMRLWVFDRSGAYNSEKFDIHEEPARLVKTIAGYALITDAELGLNMFIKRDGNGKYILARNVKISLEDKPIASTTAIVCRGKHAIEEGEAIQRTGSTWQREGRLLKLAKDRGITCIAHWFNHKQVTIDGDPDTISHLRQAMEFGPQRKLIDIDLAKEVDSVPSGASHRTGTMQFMAIEVLQGKGHTYRHDIESFFHVFIWMCIRYGHKDVDLEGTAAPSGSKPNKTRVRPMKTSRLRGWYSGTYPEIARNKLGDMVGFEDVAAEFAPKFTVLKGLAEELRNVLFRSRDLAPFTGTYKDRNIMYEGMINAFNKAISHLGKEPQLNA
ncbi:hypothetical protein BJ878DRAFT_536604 [Calycina marina]|uniref:Fungal-type protein kinase domain-containing protein n=1 Tax=Calycina marina TaxID=1763456 RepID=A0A9P7YX70_9HELO|nr:hypothetical protein BJ878DRAFT_536604 [Calycina marina]